MKELLCMLLITVAALIVLFSGCMTDDRWTWKGFKRNLKEQDIVVLCDRVRNGDRAELVIKEVWKSIDDPDWPYKVGDALPNKVFRSHLYPTTNDDTTAWWEIGHNDAWWDQELVLCTDLNLRFKIPTNMLPALAIETVPVKNGEILEQMPRTLKDVKKELGITEQKNVSP
jgi:hypothetical protein